MPLAVGSELARALSPRPPRRPVLRLPPVRPQSFTRRRSSHPADCARRAPAFAGREYGSGSSPRFRVPSTCGVTRLLIESPKFVQARLCGQCAPLCRSHHRSGVCRPASPAKLLEDHAFAARAWCVIACLALGLCILQPFLILKATSARERVVVLDGAGTFPVSPVLGSNKPATGGQARHG